VSYDYDSLSICAYDLITLEEHHSHCLNSLPVLELDLMPFDVGPFALVAVALNSPVNSKTRLLPFVVASFVGVSV
jgi:hypothetical protein